MSRINHNITGTNLGNLLFQDAVIRELSFSKHSINPIGWDLWPYMAPDINNHCSTLVLPLANSFRKEFAWRLDVWAETIRKIKTNVVVVGVGCQADAGYNFDNLRPIRRSVYNFVSAVLDRSASIGVRGEFTYSYLRRLGFKDIEVIGCPSMFMYGNFLRAPRPIETINKKTKLSVNISSASFQSEFSQGLEKARRMIDLAGSHYDDMEFIPQEMASIEELILRNSNDQAENSGLTNELFKKLKSNGKIISFLGTREWIDHLATRDLTVGTRLHGTIASIIAGTPAHLLVHDSRTLELAQYFEIPHTDLRTVTKAPGPDELYARSDYNKMLQAHASRYSTYLSFLRHNNISVDERHEKVLRNDTIITSTSNIDQHIYNSSSIRSELTKLKRQVGAKHNLKQKSYMLIIIIYTQIKKQLRILTHGTITISK